MNETQNNPYQARSEGTKKARTQYNKVKKAFSDSPKTMLMVSVETGILRANICRYVSKMKKHGDITFVKKGICPISKYRAGFYFIENSNTNNL
jgi:hypothetical protein